MKYFVRVVDEDDNILLTVGTDSVDLSRRSDQKMVCQQIMEVCQQWNDKQIISYVQKTVWPTPSPSTIKDAKELFGKDGKDIQKNNS